MIIFPKLDTFLVENSTRKHLTLFSNIRTHSRKYWALEMYDRFIVYDFEDFEEYHFIALDDGRCTASVSVKNIYSSMKQSFNSSDNLKCIEITEK